MSDCLDDYQLTQDDNNNYSTWGDAEEEEEEEEKEEKALEMMTNDDDGIQEIYLISDTDDPTALTEDDELEKSEDESSDPIPRAHVMHKYGVSVLLDDDMVLLFVKAVMSANFFWTRLGLSEEEALQQLITLDVQLKDVLADFIGRQKEQCLVAARQVRRLKQAIHSATEDLVTLIGEQQLAAFLCTLKEQESPLGADQKVDSYLRVQKAALKRRLQAMLKVRNESLQAFDQLKAECLTTAQKLGHIDVADALEPTVKAILEKRVANYEEVECLQRATDQLKVQLAERVAHCQALSVEVLKMNKLVPVEKSIVNLDEHRLLLLLSPPDKESPDEKAAEGDCEKVGKRGIIYSEKQLHLLKKLHTEVHQVALNTWTELKETSEQLGKLYRLFEMDDPERRHPHFNIVEAVQVKLGELQQQQHQTNVDNEEEGEETLTEAQCDPSFLLLQTLALIFTDQHHLTLSEALKELAAELSFYTKQKSERISELITACRAQFARQLAEWCLVEVEALKGDGRFGFLFTSPEHFEEHLLDVHQAEMDRLRQYAARHQAILSLVGKWRRLKAEAAELEEEMATGALIRNNRGGILEKMLSRQRANKKQLAATTAQISAWLIQQKKNAAGGQQKTELDRLLPFELYSLRVEDIEREVVGCPVVMGHQRVTQKQSASVRRPQNGRAKLSMVTPATTTTTAAYTPGRSLPFLTPLYAKTKKLPVSKLKLFQSLSTTTNATNTSKYQKQQSKQKWQPPSSSFSMRTAYQAKNKYY
ncbi:hypothetical protein TYRP_001078 [Tyrophagus putrescentiae]|nr:hypothetical protein TYRP_001078 [Tyrophagus putrescentiae]